jgi:hypothetical protein
VTEQELVREQYASDANLRARIEVHQRFSTSTLSYPRWVFDGYDFGVEADVLEVGCGNGLMWRENLDRIRDGWRLTLTDVSPGTSMSRTVHGRSAKSRARCGRAEPFARR